jgi:hypothetical protein
MKLTIRILAILVALVVGLVLLIVGALSHPGIFFPEQKQYRAITVYSECPIGPATDSVMAEVFRRLDAVPTYDPDQAYDLCLCCTRERFGFFSRLKRGPTQIMGFQFFHSTYVNCELLGDLAKWTGGRPKYMAREGSIVHTATHELMHGYLSDAYGTLASRRLPEWKSEGYCEYGVNQYVAPRDSGFSLAERIDIYSDDTQWNATASTHRGHYLWGLMMEYLINVKGMTLEQVMADSVTTDDVLPQMMDWRASLR